MGDRYEAQLAGFEPSFTFEPVDPIAPAEFEDRVRRMRVDAAAGDYDALLLHCDEVGWYHMSNSYLRYACDWIREGVLIIPTDPDRPSTLLTFFGSGVLYPPPGEPTWVEDVRQVGGWGREVYARAGDPVVKACEAAADVLGRELGLERGRFATIGDRTSGRYWAGLQELLPRAAFEPRADIVLRMQRVRSPHEQALVRAAAQLIDVGIQAAQHVAAPGVTDHELYAAFTYAQLARGGETGDGYQIGVNRFGTHISKPYGHVLRDGDIVQLYISHVTYHGYDAQAARMIVVGTPTPEQEDVIAMCVDGVQRAMAVAAPGVPVRDVNAAAFGPYIERGRLGSADARTMPYILSPDDDGRPRRIARERIADPDLERQGRTLDHVYPPAHGPIGPSLGHSVNMPGMRGYTVISTNHDVLEPGMTLVAHSQWLDPGTAGANVGNCLLITEDGNENLNAHTALEPFRVDA